MSRLAACLVAWVALAAPLAASLADVGELLKELKAAYKAKDSGAAVNALDQLVQSYESLSEKEKDEVVKATELAFTTRRDEGEDVERLFIAASASLANMGADGEKGLLRALAQKHVRSKPKVVATLVEGLGRQVNPAMVDQLLPWLKPDKPLGANAPVIVGASHALARYREAEGKLRKRISGELVAVYADLDARYQTEHKKPAPDPELEAGFQQVEKPLLDSLRALTGEQFENSEDWKKWWATAKDQDWEKG